MTRGNEQTNNSGDPSTNKPEGEPGQGSDIAWNLREINARIAQAALRAGRRPEEITLVAVSKTFPISALAEALATGQRVFGESRIQEALPKIEALAALETSPPPPEWHLIGHLQRNKAASAVGRFALIHSVDSVRLIEELNARAGAAGLIQRILLELNVSGEESKLGADPSELPALLEALDRSPHLLGEGLMTIPPYDLDPEAARPYFRRLRELLAGLNERPRFHPCHLSMGMSGDFEVAIEEGATLVRVGSAIFGSRG